MFPAELTHHASWVVWRYVALPGRAKPAKLPYSPVHGGPADTTNPNDWASYGYCVDFFLAHEKEYNGIGFVFSAADPYTGIDLDEPDNEQERNYMYNVLQSFNNTYIERSPSKKGYHIFVRGKVANERKIKGCEIYPHSRFFTITGDTYNDTLIRPNDYWLEHIWWSMGGKKIEGPKLSDGQDQRYTDEEIYDIACAASNGKKFHDLFHGKYLEYYSDQSRADQALVNMLSFYSRNVLQITRMFYASDLGQREKAKRQGKNGKLGYLDQMIQNSFDNLVPEISLDDLINSFDKRLHEEREALKAKPAPMLGNGWTYPQGLLGDIAEFIYQSAPRPVREIALAGAIGLMAGICGRAYNISNTGLNQYLLVLASTGTGKEAAKSGISRLIKECKPLVAVAGDFLGPAAISSGQALIKYMSKNQCFVSVLGEFGLTLQRICGPMANSSDIALRQILLDIYNKSGVHQDIQPSIYSDKSNNTEVIHAPNLSILGETTPASYFPFLDDYMIAQGLIPRFTSIEYTGKRPSLNKRHAQAAPSESLITRMSTLMTNSLICQQSQRAIEVRMDANAEEYMDAFDRYCDDKCNDADEGVAKHMWTRADIKLKKMAALIAVGVNLYDPCITVEMAAWARNVVEKDILNVISRLNVGMIGQDSNEQHQVFAVAGLMKDYAVRPFDHQLQNYGVDEEMHKQHIITASYIQRRLLSRSIFSKDRAGSTRALQRAFQNLIDDGAIIEMKGTTMMERFKCTAKAYGLVDLRRFSEMTLQHK